jgi:hypothetical protein
MELLPIKGNLTFITSGSLLMKSLDFPTSAGNVILKLLEQAANKTFTISRWINYNNFIKLSVITYFSSLLVNGYNAIFISNGLKRLSYFLVDKVLEFSRPISQLPEIVGILKHPSEKKK